jgi:hypothetical protein
MNIVLHVCGNIILLYLCFCNCMINYVRFVANFVDQGVFVQLFLLGTICFHIIIDIMIFQELFKIYKNYYVLIIMLSRKSIHKSII